MFRPVSRRAAVLTALLTALMASACAKAPTEPSRAKGVTVRFDNVPCDTCIVSVGWH